MDHNYRRSRSTSLYSLSDYYYNIPRNRPYNYDEYVPVYYGRRNNYFYEIDNTYSTSYNYQYKQMASLLENTNGTEANGTVTNGIATDNTHHKQINGKYHDEIAFPSILREKISNKDPSYLANSASDHDWLYDVDIFREKLKTQHFNTANNISNGNRIYNDQNNFNYIENDKINQLYSENSRVKANELNLDNKFHTRSESEPNNISELRFSPSTLKISNNLVNEHRSSIGKKLPPTPPNNNKSRIRNSPDPMEYRQNQPSNNNDNKKKAPPKVLIYNNIQALRSPKSRKSIINCNSSTSRISSSIRPHSRNANEYRRSRTKSPSPTFNQNKAKRFEMDESNLKFESIRKVNSEREEDKCYDTFIDKNLSLSKPRSEIPFSINNLDDVATLTSQNNVSMVLNSNYDSGMFASKADKKLKLNHNFAEENDEDDDSCYDDEEYELSEDDDYIESSSDSEDGYRGHEMSRTEKSESPLSLNIQVTNPSTPESILVPSLFPNVPPYLSFSTNLEKGPPVPSDLHKVLKWKLSKVMPKVVRFTLLNSGCRVLKKTNEWMGTWGKHMKSPCFRTIRPYQKMNHLPGSFKIGRKDSCWKNLQKQVIRHGKKEFGFMPKTYIFPNDINILRKTWPKYQQRNVKWIIKPPASARGTGIKVVFAWSQIPKRKPLIVQRYIERPLLINGSKFDIRLYVLVTSINPLRVYMYKDGLARFASVKYSTKSETLHDRCMHLTNYSINKHSSNYAKNEDVNACDGHKWTLKSLMTYLSNTGVDVSLLWITMKNLVLRTLLAGEEGINNMTKINTGSRYNTYELFGFDILLDSNLIPWLLEVNISPSLHSDLPLDMHVKGPLVQAVLNTALYHVPPKISSEKQKDICAKTGIKGPLCYDKRLYITYLSRAEKIKHNQFTRKDLEDRDEYLNAILENLTPDDVRCLITVEDELARCLPLERIFPTNKSYKLLKYTESPRYYNRLLDAWENRYGSDRIAGIKLLKELCETNYHLQVPPAPTQRNIQIRTRTMKKIFAISTLKPSITTSTIMKCVSNKNKRTKFSCWALAKAAKTRISKKKLVMLKKSERKTLAKYNNAALQKLELPMSTDQIQEQS